ncbi:MAG: 2-phosphosulfolactate phosphatase [Anaerolineae bacterium]|nr:2-phosphosulfolactate phosphatase [Anaerolineae bacterium]
MKINRVDLEHCGHETDMVVVIDVLRAFTTAAIAFSRGAKDIILAGSVENLFQLAKNFPQALTIGEVNGIPIEGVNFGNSPSIIEKADLENRTIIQRTTAGTQGILRSTNARIILATSLCCGWATARWIERESPDSLTLVETGVLDGGWGDEDKACADYVEALIRGETIDHHDLIRRVVGSRSGSFYSSVHDDVFPRQDLAIATDIDRFNFTMKVFQIGDNYCLRPLWE